MHLPSAVVLHVARSLHQYEFQPPDCIIRYSVDSDIDLETVNAGTPPLPSHNWRLVTI